MAFADLYDARVPQAVRDLALERLQTHRSLENRTDIDEGTRILALQCLHSALPDYELKTGEIALCGGISVSTAQRRRR